MVCRCTSPISSIDLSSGRMVQDKRNVMYAQEIFVSSDTRLWSECAASTANDLWVHLIWWRWRFRVDIAFCIIATHLTEYRNAATVLTNAKLSNNSTRSAGGFGQCADNAQFKFRWKDIKWTTTDENEMEKWLRRREQRANRFKFKLNADCRCASHTYCLNEIFLFFFLYCILHLPDCHLVRRHTQPKKRKENSFAQNNKTDDERRTRQGKKTNLCGTWDENQIRKFDSNYLLIWQRFRPSDAPNVYRAHCAQHHANLSNCSTFLWHC